MSCSSLGSSSVRAIDTASSETIRRCSRDCSIPSRGMIPLPVFSSLWSVFPTIFSSHSMSSKSSVIWNAMPRSRAYSQSSSVFSSLCFDERMHPRRTAASMNRPVLSRCTQSVFVSVSWYEENSRSLICPRTTPISPMAFASRRTASMEPVSARSSSERVLRASHTSTATSAQYAFQTVGFPRRIVSLSISGRSSCTSV